MSSETNQKLAAPARAASGPECLNGDRKVSIKATDDAVYVAVTVGDKMENFTYGTSCGDGYLTGADLAEVLSACGMNAEYDYLECDCSERSWYRPGHDSACPVSEVE